jgi:hypothetical protein
MFGEFSYTYEARFDGNTKDGCLDSLKVGMVASIL